MADRDPALGGLNNDTICGVGGTKIGGPGPDSLEGGAGDHRDNILGGNDADIMATNTPNLTQADTLPGGIGSDSRSAGWGYEGITESGANRAGTDTIFAGGQEDTVFAAAGDDNVNGGEQAGSPLGGGAGDSGGGGNARITSS